MDKPPALYFEAHVFFCVNERLPGHKRGSCAASGAMKLKDYMKARSKELGLEGKVRINASGCLDRCELGPVVVVYPEGIWYAIRSRDDVDTILQQHLVGGQLVPHLMLHPADRGPEDRPDLFPSPATEPQTPG